MKQAILRLSNALYQVSRYAATAALAVMFLTVMIQVVARYVFAAPPIWTEDVARTMMVWTGLLGATLSFKTRTDAVLLKSVFSGRLSPVASILQSLAVLTFTLPVIYFSFVGLRGGFARGYLARQAQLTADTLGIQMVWIVAIVPIAMIMIVIHLAARWADPVASTPSVDMEIS